MWIALGIITKKKTRARPSCTVQLMLSISVVRAYALEWQIEVNGGTTWPPPLRASTSDFEEYHVFKGD